VRYERSRTVDALQVLCARREDWIRWAMQFMRRGLWLGDSIEVHGPHDSSGQMWGDAEAWTDDAASSRWAHRNYVSCVFSASGTKSTHRLTNILVRSEPDRDDCFPVLKASELTPKARRWMRAAGRALAKLEAERREESLKSMRLQAVFRKP